MQKNKILLSIIIVSYNDAPLLERCVNSICKKFGARDDWEIVIVNNDSRQDIKSLGFDLSRVNLIESRKNLGFGGGNNLGVRHARGKYIFFLNPDAEVLDPFPKRILAEFGKQGDLGAIGGGILSEGRKTQKWCCGKKVTFFNLVLNNLGIVSSRKLWKDRKIKKVDWVSGASFFIERKFFLELGGFDENIFMYFEDVDLCERIRKRGKNIMLFPSHRILHKGGGTYDEKNKKEQKRHYYDSLVYYFEKHRSRAEAWIVRTLRKLFFA